MWESVLLNGFPFQLVILYYKITNKQIFICLFLENFTNLSEKEKIEIKSLKRGESLMFIGDSHVLAKVECSELEKKIIE